MRIPRVYAGSDGGSVLDSVELDLESDEPGHIEGRRFEWSDPQRPIPFSNPWAATQLNFWTCPADYPAGWHNPPSRVFLVVLSGSAAIEVSSGERFELNAGDIGLFEDTTGQGHLFGPAGGDDVVGIVVAVTDDSPRRAG